MSEALCSQLLHIGTVITAIQAQLAVAAQLIQRPAGAGADLIGILLHIVIGPILDGGVFVVRHLLPPDVDLYGGVLVLLPIRVQRQLVQRLVDIQLAAFDLEDGFIGVILYLANVDQVAVCVGNLLRLGHGHLLTGFRIRIGIRAVQVGDVAFGVAHRAVIPATEIIAVASHGRIGLRSGFLGLLAGQGIQVILAIRVVAGQQVLRADVGRTVAALADIEIHPARLGEHGIQVQRQSRGVHRFITARNIPVSADGNIIAVGMPGTVEV